MADPRFFDRAAPISLRQILTLGNLECASKTVDADRPFNDVAPLDTADANCVSFMHNVKYRAALQTTGAGACIVPEEAVPHIPSTCLALVAQDPHRAYALVAQAFYSTPALDVGVHERAFVDPKAILGSGVQISAGAVIEAGAEIGDHSFIGANAVVGKAVQMGKHCRIEAHVTLSHCSLGQEVHILPGTRIGQRGFGFAMGPQGHEKVPQLGRVHIGDACEIGANVCIDRGSGPDTIIGAGTMIDNLVQIAHNVQTGENCVIVANAGIAGSTKLGDFVIVAGGASVAGHLNLSSGTQIMACSGLMRDTEVGDVLCGTPAIDKRSFFKREVLLNRMIKDKPKASKP